MAPQQLDATTIAIGVLIAERAWQIFGAGKKSKDEVQLQIQIALKDVKESFEKDIAAAKNDSSKDALHAVDILKVQFENLANTMTDLSDLIRSSMKSFNDNMTTKQDHLQLVVRMEAVEMKAHNHELDIQRLKDNCAANGHALRQTTSIPRITP